MAMEIQKSYLPPEELCLARSEMCVRYRPARTIGGDFYASLALPGDRLLAAVGDVSGKGIPAALTTAQITAEIHAHSELLEQGLDAYVTALNTELCQRLARGALRRHHVPAARPEARRDAGRLRGDSSNRGAGAPTCGSR